MPTTTHHPIARPLPEFVAGPCFECGAQVLSTCYWVGGIGYMLFHECRASQGSLPSCGYRKAV